MILNHPISESMASIVDISIDGWCERAPVSAKGAMGARGASEGAKVRGADHDLRCAFDHLQHESGGGPRVSPRRAVASTRGRGTRLADFWPAARGGGRSSLREEQRP